MDEALSKLIEEECFIRNFTPTTCKIYKFNIDKFLTWADKPIEQLDLYDARNYIIAKRHEGKTAWYCNSMSSNISFFYRHILHIPWSYDIVPRMKIDWKLPTVLTREEIEKLIDTATVTRNKAIIALLYSSGLRAGEIVRLAPGDIYMSSMQVHIRNSKNRGDHWTVLSERTLELLAQYWRENPEERDTLFVTLRKPHRPLNVGGIEIMLRKVGNEAGIDVHPHTLRHSFATHLIENDVSREYVQAMLGHRSSSSTAIYVHVTNKRIMGITSPLDLPFSKEVPNTHSNNSEAHHG